jgi:hypothetical protein
VAESGVTHLNAARTRKVRAQRHARQAAEKASERRGRQTGAAGWVAERAGEWDLRGPDPGLMQAQKYFWNPLMDYWFRMEIDGWERIPESPVLLIGIHAGAPFVWDAWTVGVQWWRHFGPQRTLHGTAHDALMALPGVGAYFRRMGVLPAHADSIAAALAAGHDVALWPGGERDSLRPWTQRDEAVLAGRKGFVKDGARAGRRVTSCARRPRAAAAPCSCSSGPRRPACAPPGTAVRGSGPSAGSYRSADHRAVTRTCP